MENQILYFAAVLVKEQKIQVFLNNFGTLFSCPSVSLVLLFCLRKYIGVCVCELESSSSSTYPTDDKRKEYIEHDY